MGWVAIEGAIDAAFQLAKWIAEKTKRETNTPS